MESRIPLWGRLAIGVVACTALIFVTAAMGNILIGIAISPILLVGAYRATWWRG